ncbi:AbrB family transcriptional regulator [Pseudomonas matsuisoli]|nr:AbrB family transcriptional regulator [Pseudomonas matsuisoli]
MLGPLVGNLIASIRGFAVGVPESLRLAFLGVLGLILGAQVSPDLAARLLDWPVSAVLLLIGVGCSTAACASWYRRTGFDPVSAWFASAPGAMTAMITMGEACGGDPRKIAISQSLRVVLVLLILPPLFWFQQGAGSVGANDASQKDASALYLLLLLPLLIGIGRRCRLPTPALLAPLLLSASLSATDTAHFVLPNWTQNGMLLVLGCAIGSRFQGMSRTLLAHHLYGASIATLISLLVLAVFAEAIHQVVGVSRAVAILAVAPGGIGELAILAVALDLDPTFVAFHHLLRLVVLMFFAPIWARWLSARGSRGGAP